MFGLVFTMMTLQSQAQTQTCSWTAAEVQCWYENSDAGTLSWIQGYANSCSKAPPQILLFKLSTIYVRASSVSPFDDWPSTFAFSSATVSPHPTPTFTLPDEPECQSQVEITYSPVQIVGEITGGPTSQVVFVCDHISIPCITSALDNASWTYTSIYDIVIKSLINMKISAGEYAGAWTWTGQVSEIKLFTTTTATPVAITSTNRATLGRDRVGNFQPAPTCSSASACDFNPTTSIPFVIPTGTPPSQSQFFTITFATPTNVQTMYLDLAQEAPPCVIALLDQSITLTELAAALIDTLQDTEHGGPELLQMYTYNPSGVFNQQEHFLPVVQNVTPVLTVTIIPMSLTSSTTLDFREIRMWTRQQQLGSSIMSFPDFFTISPSDASIDDLQLPLSSYDFEVEFIGPAFFVYNVSDSSSTDRTMWLYFGDNSALTNKQIDVNLFNADADFGAPDLNSCSTFTLSGTYGEEVQISIPKFVSQVFIKKTNPMADCELDFDESAEGFKLKAIMLMKDDCTNFEFIPSTPLTIYFNQSDTTVTSVVKTLPPLSDQGSCGPITYSIVETVWSTFFSFSVTANTITMQKPTSVDFTGVSTVTLKASLDDHSGAYTTMQFSVNITTEGCPWKTADVSCWFTHADHVGSQPLISWSQYQGDCPIDPPMFGFPAHSYVPAPALSTELFDWPTTFPVTVQFQSKCVSRVSVGIWDVLVGGIPIDSLNCCPSGSTTCQSSQISLDCLNTHLNQWGATSIYEVEFQAVLVMGISTPTQDYFGIYNPQNDLYFKFYSSPSATPVAITSTNRATIGRDRIGNFQPAPTCSSASACDLNPTTSIPFVIPAGSLATSASVFTITFAQPTNLQTMFVDLNSAAPSCTFIGQQPGQTIQTWLSNSLLFDIAMNDINFKPSGVFNLDEHILISSAVEPITTLLIVPIETSSATTLDFREIRLWTRQQELQSTIESIPDFYSVTPSSASIDDLQRPRSSHDFEVQFTGPAFFVYNVSDSSETQRMMWFYFADNSALTNKKLEVSFFAADPDFMPNDISSSCSEITLSGLYGEEVQITVPKGVSQILINKQKPGASCQLDENTSAEGFKLKAMMLMKDDCSNFEFIPSTPFEMYFDQTDTTVTSVVKTLPPLSDQGSCGSITYSIYEWPWSTFLSIDNTAKTITLQGPTSIDLVGNHTITLRAINGWGETNMKFKVTILNPCKTDPFVMNATSWVSPNATTATFGWPNLPTYTPPSANCLPWITATFKESLRVKDGTTQTIPIQEQVFCMMAMGPGSGSPTNFTIACLAEHLNYQLSYQTQFTFNSIYDIVFQYYPVIQMERPFDPTAPPGPIQYFTRQMPVIEFSFSPPSITGGTPVAITSANRSTAGRDRMGNFIPPPTCTSAQACDFNPATSSAFVIPTDTTASQLSKVFMITFEQKINMKTMFLDLNSPAPGCVFGSIKGSWELDQYFSINDWQIQYMTAMSPSGVFSRATHFIASDNGCPGCYGPQIQLQPISSVLIIPKDPQSTATTLDFKEIRIWTRDQVILPGSNIMTAETASVPSTSNSVGEVQGPQNHENFLVTFSNQASMFLKVIDSASSPRMLWLYFGDNSALTNKQLEVSFFVDAPNFLATGPSSTCQAFTLSGTYGEEVQIPIPTGVTHVLINKKTAGATCQLDSSASAEGFKLKAMALMQDPPCTSYAEALVQANTYVDPTWFDNISFVPNSSIVLPWPVVQYGPPECAASLLPITAIAFYSQRTSFTVDLAAHTLSFQSGAKSPELLYLSVRFDTQIDASMWPPYWDSQLQGPYYAPPGPQELGFQFLLVEQPSQVTSASNSKDLIPTSSCSAKDGNSDPNQSAGAAACDFILTTSVLSTFTTTPGSLTFWVTLSTPKLIQTIFTDLASPGPQVKVSIYPIQYGSPQPYQTCQDYIVPNGLFVCNTQAYDLNPYMPPSMYSQPANTLYFAPHAGETNLLDIREIRMWSDANAGSTATVVSPSYKLPQQGTVWGTLQDILGLDQSPNLDWAVTFTGSSWFYIDLGEDVFIHNVWLWFGDNSQLTNKVLEVSFGNTVPTGPFSNCKSLTITGVQSEEWYVQGISPYASSGMRYVVINQKKAGATCQLPTTGEPISIRKVAVFDWYDFSFCNNAQLEILHTDYDFIEWSASTNIALPWPRVRPARCANAYFSYLAIKQIPLQIGETGAFQNSNVQDHNLVWSSGTTEPSSLTLIAPSISYQGGWGWNGMVDMPYQGYSFPSSFNISFTFYHDACKESTLTTTPDFTVPIVYLQGPVVLPQLTYTRTSGCVGNLTIDVLDDPDYPGDFAIDSTTGAWTYNLINPNATWFPLDITLRVIFPSSSSNKYFEEFTITLTDGCLNLTYVTPITFTNMIYDQITSTAPSVQNLPLTTAFARCGPVTYSLSPFYGDVTLQITQSTTSQTISLESTDINYVGPFLDVELNANFDDYPEVSAATLTFNVTIQNACILDPLFMNTTNLLKPQATTTTFGWPTLPTLTPTGVDCSPWVVSIDRGSITIKQGTTVIPLSGVVCPLEGQSESTEIFSMACLAEFLGNVSGFTYNSLYEIVFQFNPLMLLTNQNTLELPVFDFSFSPPTFTGGTPVAITSTNRASAGRDRIGNFIPKPTCTKEAACDFNSATALAFLIPTGTPPSQSQIFTITFAQPINVQTMYLDLNQAAPPCVIALLNQDITLADFALALADLLADTLYGGPQFVQSHTYKPSGVFNRQEHFIPVVPFTTPVLTVAITPMLLTSSTTLDLREIRIWTRYQVVLSGTNIITAQTAVVPSTSDNVGELEGPQISPFFYVAFINQAYMFLNVIDSASSPRMLWLYFGSNSALTNKQLEVSFFIDAPNFQATAPSSTCSAFTLSGTYGEEVQIPIPAGITHVMINKSTPGATCQLDSSTSPEGFILRAMVLMQDPPCTNSDEVKVQANTYIDPTTWLNNIEFLPNQSINFPWPVVQYGPPECDASLLPITAIQITGSSDTYTCSLTDNTFTYTTGEIAPPYFYVKVLFDDPNNFTPPGAPIITQFFMFTELPSQVTSALNSKDLIPTSTCWAFDDPSNPNDIFGAAACDFDLLTSVRPLFVDISGPLVFKITFESTQLIQTIFIDLASPGPKVKVSNFVTSQNTPLPYQTCQNYIVPNGLFVCNTQAYDVDFSGNTLYFEPLTGETNFLDIREIRLWSEANAGSTATVVSPSYELPQQGTVWGTLQDILGLDQTPYLNWAVTFTGSSWFYIDLGELVQIQSVWLWFGDNSWLTNFVLEVSYGNTVPTGPFSNCQSLTITGDQSEEWYVQGVTPIPSNGVRYVVINQQGSANCTLPTAGEPISIRKVAVFDWQIDCSDTQLKILDTDYNFIEFLPNQDIRLPWPRISPARCALFYYSAWQSQDVPRLQLLQDSSAFASADVDVRDLFWHSGSTEPTTLTLNAPAITFETGYGSTYSFSSFDFSFSFYHDACKESILTTDLTVPVFYIEGPVVLPELTYTRTSGCVGNLTTFVLYNPDYPGDFAIDSTTGVMTYNPTNPNATWFPLNVTMRVIFPSSSPNKYFEDRIIIMRDGCLNLTFATPITFTDMTYDQVTSTAPSVQNLPLTTAFARCGPVTYSLLNGAVNWPFLQITQSTTVQTITLQSTLLSQIATYHGVTLNANFTDYPQGIGATLTFNVTISHFCNETGFTAPIITTYAPLIYNQTAMSIPWPSFNISDTYCFALQNLVFKDQSGNDMVASGKISVNFTTQQISYLNPTSWDAFFSMQGVFNTSTNYTGPATNITLIDGCQFATYQTPAPAQVAVKIGQLGVFSVIPEVVPSLSRCAMAYTLQEQYPFLTFDNTTRNMTFFSSNMTEIGLHTIKVVAGVAAYMNVNNVTMSFDLQLNDPCLFTTLSMAQLQDQSLFAFDTTPTQVTIDSIPDSYSANANITGLCGNLSYSVQDPLLEPLITFVPLLNDSNGYITQWQMNLQPDPSIIGIMSVTVFVNLENYPTVPAASSSFILTVRCGICVAELINVPLDKSYTSGQTDIIWLTPAEPHANDLQVTVTGIDPTLKLAVVMNSDLGALFVYDTDPELSNPPLNDPDGEPLSTLVTVNLDSEFESQHYEVTFTITFIPDPKPDEVQETTAEEDVLIEDADQGTLETNPGEANSTLIDEGTPEDLLDELLADDEGSQNNLDENGNVYLDSIAVSVPEESEEAKMLEELANTNPEELAAAIAQMAAETKLDPDLQESQQASEQAPEVDPDEKPSAAAAEEALNENLAALEALDNLDLGDFADEGDSGGENQGEDGGSQGNTDSGDSPGNNSTDISAGGGSTDGTQPETQAKGEANSNEGKQNQPVKQKVTLMDPSKTISYKVPRPVLKPTEVNPNQVDYAVPEMKEFGNDGAATVAFSQPIDVEPPTLRIRRMSSLNLGQNLKSKVAAKIEKKQAPHYKQKNQIDVSVLLNGALKTDTKINFTWDIASIKPTGIDLRVTFADSFALVANKDQHYELQFLFKGEGFKSKHGAGIPKGFVMRVPIPTQLPSDPSTKAFAASAKSTGSNAKDATIANMVVSFTMSASMSLLFGMINCLQLFVHLPLLDLDFSANANMVEMQILDIANFDLLPMDTIHSTLFNFTETKPYNRRFEIDGYGSKNAMDNLGTLWIFIVATPLWFLLVKVILFLSKRYTKLGWMKKFVDDPEEDVAATFRNAFQRLILESFYEMLISSWISFTIVRTYTRSDKLAIFVGKYFCVVGVVCLLLFAMYFVIYKATKMVQLNKQFLEDRAVLKREKCEEILKKAEEEASKLEPYGKVYTEGLKQHTKWALFYNVFFLLRVVIFVLIAFLLSGYAVVQVIIVSCMSLAMLVYIIRVRPFEEEQENVMAIINETGNLFMALSIYAFAGNYSTSKQGYQVVGWLIVGDIGIMVAANFAVIIAANVGVVIKAIKMRWYAHKIKTIRKKRGDAWADKVLARQTLASALQENVQAATPAKVNQPDEEMSASRRGLLQATPDAISAEEARKQKWKNVSLAAKLEQMFKEQVAKGIQEVDAAFEEDPEQVKPKIEEENIIQKPYQNQRIQNSIARKMKLNVVSKSDQCLQMMNGPLSMLIATQPTAQNERVSGQPENPAQVANAMANRIQQDVQQADQLLPFESDIDKVKRERAQKDEAEAAIKAETEALFAKRYVPRKERLALKKEQQQL